VVSKHVLLHVSPTMDLVASETNHVLAHILASRTGLLQINSKPVRAFYPASCVLTVISRFHCEPSTVVGGVFHGNVHR